MATYKNIRLPKRGGGTRLQRVQVLASGKYKFVKNLVKGKTSKTPKKRKSKSGSKKVMARRGMNLLGTAFKFLKLGSFVAPGVLYYQTVGLDMKNKIARTLIAYAGIGKDNKHSWGLMGQMWLPLLGTTLVTYAVPKIGGLIRRLKLW